LTERKKNLSNRRLICLVLDFFLGICVEKYSNSKKVVMRLGIGFLRPKRLRLSGLKTLLKKTEPKLLAL
jgi:hypothetical protein